MAKTFQIAGILAFITLATALTMGLLFRCPMIKLELPQDTQTVQNLLASEKTRDAAKGSLEMDFLFIASYWLLFLSMSLLLAQSQIRWTLFLAVIAAVLSTASAFYDVLENFRMFQMINSVVITDTIVNDVRRASVIKWIVVFVSMMSLSTLFFIRDGKIKLIGLYFLLLSMTGLAALCLKKAELVGLAMILLLPVLLLIGILFTFQSKNFANW